MVAIDTLARLVDQVAPRRTALFGLLGAGLPNLLARAGGADAKKRRKKRKKKCGKNQQKCGSTCIPKDACCGCSEAECCDGACVDLATDPNNCGACGRTCPTAICTHGACACLSDDECPDSCSCLPRAQGVAACTPFDEITFEPCTIDDDCPLGAFCIQVDEARFCSGICPG